MNMQAATSKSDNRLVDPQFLEDVLQGLSGATKSLPCKYFYDEQGSALFEQICELDEYYLTRTELTLLSEIKQELAECIGPHAQVIEPGSGAGVKIRLLFSALQQPRGYVPFEIAEDMLGRASAELAEAYPQLQVQPVVGDFTQPMQIPYPDDQTDMRRAVFFPGSTIGNFSPEQATALLKRFGDWVGPSGGLVIGVDLHKSASILEAAYDDAQGVTAAFNLNILKRINRELDGQFKLAQFRHQALFNQELSRIEMHLVSTCEQRVRVFDREFVFAEGESIHTENSYKYSVEAFQRICEAAGLQHRRHWTDTEQLFSLHFLTVPQK